MLRLIVRIYPNYVTRATLRPRQYGCHFADDIFECIFLNENQYCFISKSAGFFPKDSLKNNPTLVQIWLDVEKMTSHYLNGWWHDLLVHICITRSRLKGRWGWNNDMVHICVLDALRTSCPTLRLHGATVTPHHLADGPLSKLCHHLYIMHRGANQISYHPLKYALHSPSITTITVVKTWVSYNARKIVYCLCYNLQWSAKVLQKDGSDKHMIKGG